MALYARKETGKGTKVDTSLFASGIWCNAIGVVQTQFDRKHLNPDPLRPTDPFNQTYKCKDGRWIGVYCNEYEMDREKWYGLFGIPEFADDPDYASIQIMQDNGKIENIITICNGIFLTKTAQEWRDYLSANNCACEIMKESCEVSKDPQAIENEYMVPVEYPDEQPHYSDDAEPADRIQRIRQAQLQADRLHRRRYGRDTDIHGIFS